MFTGIIDHCGTILEITSCGSALKILVACHFLDLTEGESIAVNGICLTAIQPQPQRFYCDISPETLQLTTAQQLMPGHKINLERALRMGDRFGGHVVTGHVDQCGLVQMIQHHQEFTSISFAGITEQQFPFLIKKGSIAVNGVSLTINEILPQGFQVMLIPHTLERTNLGVLKEGDKVNLEFDWMVKVIVNRSVTQRNEEQLRF